MFEIIEEKKDKFHFELEKLKMKNYQEFSNVQILVRGNEIFYCVVMQKLENVKK